jgi:hypothetical protein
MRIVVIGGTGLIGTKLVKRLRDKGHEVLAASPDTGVDTITGEGLAAALAGAQVVVDLANSPSFEAKPALEFFKTSGRNLLEAEAAAGGGHHLALSVVGADRLPEGGYLRAKVAQEKLIKASGIPTRSGPDACPLDKLAGKVLAANGDRRRVIADVHARYYGAELDDRSLTPGDHPRLGATHFDDWLSRAAAR